MKSCISIPRIYLPFLTEDGEPLPYDDSAFKAFCRYACFGPRPCGAAGKETVSSYREEVYRLLEDQDVGKLDRGALFLKRGEKKSFVAALDMEKFSFAGEAAAIRLLQETEKASAAFAYELRRELPLEFPCVTCFYFDKKDELMDVLAACPLDEVSDQELPEGGGRQKTYFVPQRLAMQVAGDLHSRREPYFIVAEGAEEAIAAKEHWENVKAGKKPFFHPARYLLTEFVNIYSDSVRLETGHRVLCGVDAETAVNFFSASKKARREGNVIVPLDSGDAAVRRVQSDVARFIAERGGTLEICADEAETRRRAAEKNTVGILFPQLEKEDVIAALKHGKTYPMSTFLPFPHTFSRFALEAREISYD